MSNVNTDNILSIENSTGTAVTGEPLKFFKTGRKTVQYSGKSASSNNSGTIVLSFKVSNDLSMEFIELARVEMQINTSAKVDHFSYNAPWKYLRADFVHYYNSVDPTSGTISDIEHINVVVGS